MNGKIIRLIYSYLIICIIKSIENNDEITLTNHKP